MSELPIRKLLNKMSPETQKDVAWACITGGPVLIVVGLLMSWTANFAAADNESSVNVLVIVAGSLTTLLAFALFDSADPTKR